MSVCHNKAWFCRKFYYMIKTQNGSNFSSMECSHDLKYDKIQQLTNQEEKTFILSQLRQPTCPKLVQIYKKNT